MEKELEFYYDRNADILNINLVKPYPEQETEELGDDIYPTSCLFLLPLR
jgi:hypothetical protein